MTQVFFFLIEWMVGLFIASFTILPILIIIFFSIPFTIKLRAAGVISSYKPIYRNVLSICLLGLIFIVAIVLMQIYIHSVNGVLFGTLFVLLFSLRKLGGNESNIQDYIQTNEDCIDKQKMVTYLVKSGGHLSQ